MTLQAAPVLVCLTAERRGRVNYRIFAPRTRIGRVCIVHVVMITAVRFMHGIKIIVMAGTAKLTAGTFAGFKALRMEMTAYAGHSRIVLQAVVIRH